MRTRVTAWLAALACAAALLCSCSKRTIIAAGESDDLVVVADAEVTPAALDTLVALAHSTVPWLLDEQSYKTTVTSPARARDLLHRRHVVLLGVWNSGEVHELAAGRITGLRSGEPAALLLYEDVWAEGQVVAVLMGRDEGDLIAYLSSHRAEILTRLETAVVERLSRTLREHPEGSAVAAMLRERYGWSLAPPSGYDLLSGAADRGFVFLRRTQPDRNLFVFWTPGGPELVTRDSVLARREELARIFYDGDRVEWRRPFEERTVTFAGRPALRLSGWWANDELLGGGPFRLHCFAVPEQGRVYIVDESLFAPGMDKVPLMRNMDAMAATFEAVLDAGTP
jgi:hypothetical protein